MLTQVKEAVLLAGAAIVVIGALGGGVAWMAGGLRPQTQVAVDELNVQMGQIQTAISQLKDRIDAMPRVTDFAAHEAHLSHIDGQIAAMGDRMTADEIKAADVAAQVNALRTGTAAPIRVPR
jgi:hypothetical protein